MGAAFLWLSLGTFVVAEVVYLIFGFILAKTKRHHRLGLRMLAESIFGAWLTSRLCHCPCDGSCDNWTCSKYRVRRSDYRGKYEAIK